MLPKYKKYIGDWYQNHDYNIRLYITFQVIKNEKEFTHVADKEFANTLIKQIAKLVEFVKRSKKMSIIDEKYKNRIGE